MHFLVLVIVAVVALLHDWAGGRTLAENSAKKIVRQRGEIKVLSQNSDVYIKLMFFNRTRTDGSIGHDVETRLNWSRDIVRCSSSRQLYEGDDTFPRH